MLSYRSLSIGGLASAATAALLPDDGCGLQYWNQHDTGGGNLHAHRACICPGTVSSKRTYPDVAG